jgi:hypothetical protein
MTVNVFAFCSIKLKFSRKNADGIWKARKKIQDTTAINWFV